VDITEAIIELILIIMATTYLMLLCGDLGPKALYPFYLFLITAHEVDSIIIPVFQTIKLRQS
jgi:hypothetical protein